MPRKPQPWFRWYVEAFGDRKLRRLTPAQRWLFVALCGAGRESCELGRLLVAPGVAMTDDELADYADVPLREVKKALPLMDALGMVRRDADGVLVVLNLRERQYESDTSTERVRRHREQARNVPDGDVGTLQPRSMKQDGNDGSNAPEQSRAETETEDPPLATLGTPPLGVDPPAPKARRGTRLPEGWTPPPDVRAALMAQFPGVSGNQWLRMHESWADYWIGVPGKDGTKLDWSATWRNGMRSRIERLQKSGPRSGSGEVDWDQAAANAAMMDGAA